MSTAITMKTVDVINRCLACIKDIDNSRLERDTRKHANKTVTLIERNHFWNKWTLGLVKIKPTEVLAEQAHASLRCRLEYPDILTSEKWRMRAICLHNLAKLSENDVMFIDMEDNVVVNWAKQIKK